MAVPFLLVGTSALASATDAPVVGGALAPQAPNGLPALVVRANGAVKASPGIGFRGDARHKPLAQPITGIAETRNGKGYWLVAADGGVFSYGDGRFYGSLVGTHLNAPVVGIASTKTGRGYWLVAADGGVFTFGDARFLGSLAGHRLDEPIVSIIPTRLGNGYRILARDGGVFTFGDATFHGSLGGSGLTDVIGLAPTPSDNGYWILRKNGGKYVDCSYPSCRPGFVAGPSVTNFGNAQDLAPLFSYVNGEKPYFDLDFIHDPVVAIVANPAAQGYVILRARIAHSGSAGTLFPS